MKNKILKVYIKNFKSCYIDQLFDIYDNDLNIIIGPNGIGKTNLIEAIDWFISNEYDTDLLPSKINKMHSIDENEVKAVELSDAQCGFVESISEAEHNRIIEELKLEEESNINYKEFYKINIRKSITGKAIFEDLNYNGEIYKNYYQEILNIYFRRFSKNYSNVVNVDLFLDKTSDDKFSVNLEKISLILDEMKENIDSPSVSKTLIESLENAIKYYDFIKREAEFKLDSRYIRNAKEENGTEYTYLIDKFVEDDNYDNDLLKFLSKNVDLESEFKRLNEISKTQNNQNRDEISRRQTEIYDYLNKECNEWIEKLFRRFDIYAIPKVQFIGNKITINVESKKSSQIGAYKTIDNSAGYIAFFQIILKLEAFSNEAKEYPKHRHLFLADEPDKNLHPYLQRQICEYFQEKQSEIENLTILITTHSPFMVNMNGSQFIIVDKMSAANALNDKNCYISGSSLIKNYSNKNIYKIQNEYVILFASKLYNEDNSDLWNLTKKAKILFTYDMENEDIKNWLASEKIELINLNGLLKKNVTRENVSRILDNVETYVEKDFANIYSKNDMLKQIGNDKNVVIFPNNKDKS